MGVLTVNGSEFVITRELLDAFNIKPHSSHYAYIADIALQEKWGSDYDEDEQQGYIDAVVDLVIDGELDSLAATDISDEGKEYLAAHVKRAVLDVEHYTSNDYTLRISYALDAGTESECELSIEIELNGAFSVTKTTIYYDDSDANNKVITMLLLKYG